MPGGAPGYSPDSFSARRDGTISIRGVSVFGAAISAALATAAGALLVMLPWLALHATKLLGVLSQATFAKEAATDGLRTVPNGGTVARLFSTQEHFYGGSYPDYLFGIVLLFAAGLTTYVFIAIYYEERDLVKYLGDDYVRYKEKVPMIIPTIGKGYDTVKGGGASTEDPVPH